MYIIGNPILLQAGRVASLHLPPTAPNLAIFHHNIVYIILYLRTCWNMLLANRARPCKLSMERFSMRMMLHHCTVAHVHLLYPV